MPRPPRPGPRRAAPRAGRRKPRGDVERPVRHDLVDALVLEVHGLVHDQGWLADRALERALRRERNLWSAERRAVAEAVYGVTRWQGQLDWLLGAGIPDTEADDHALSSAEAGARVGRRGRGSTVDLSTRYAAWLVRRDGVAPGEAARRVASSPRALAALDGADARIAAIADPVERLAVEASLPRWIAARFASELGLEEARTLARAMNERAPLTVRANLLRVPDREALRARLAAEGVAAEPTRFSPWGLVLDGRENAFALASFREGLFEIQDEGSQLIALACGARPGKLVVDACAGAGGKALALAAEMHNKGTLWALDSDADRLGEARRRATRDRVDNLRTRVIGAGPEADAQLSDLAGKADVVLVDAPCSGLGTLRRKPDARWRLAPSDPERFAALQRTLVARFGALVRSGGRLVYATCAIGAAENDDVADLVARELPFEPAPLTPLLGEERAAALGAEGNRLRLYPHRQGTDGFFLASFVRRS